MDTGETMQHKNRKGIILAAGKGTRLGAITGGIGSGTGVSKPLVPTYDKPTIYYPLSDMLSAGIDQILIIAAPDNVELFRNVIGDGSALGVSIHYDVQTEPRGIAEAFLIGKDFIGNDNVCLMFGDNVYNGKRFTSALRASVSPRGATVFAYRVDNPRDFGVVEFDENMRAISLEEKPERPKSPYAVPGTYFYTSKVVEIAKSLKPSPRGELEITDVNIEFLKQNLLDVTVLDSDTEWFDTGTPESLHDASTYVRTWQYRHGQLLGSPEAAAYQAGFISSDQLLLLATEQKKSTYGQLLLELAKNEWPQR